MIESFSKNQMKVDYCILTKLISWLLHLKFTARLYKHHISGTTGNKSDCMKMRNKVFTSVYEDLKIKTFNIGK